MRKALFVIGMLAVAACSVDHVVVAALDDASGGSPAGGDAGAAGADSGGQAGDRSADTGGVGFGGAPASGGSAGIVGILITSTGGFGADNAAGAAGANSIVVCSCLGDEVALVCGSDGITYPASCGAGIDCPPAIDCWHACPCDDPPTSTGTRLFPPECAPTLCAGDVVCMTYTNATRDMQIGCAASN
jgi:hypothetical protein